jgi:hypothetical protein
MVLLDMVIIIQLKLVNLLKQGIIVHQQQINLPQSIGLVRIYGLVPVVLKQVALREESVRNNEKEKETIRCLC